MCVFKIQSLYCFVSNTNTKINNKLNYSDERYNYVKFNYPMSTADLNLTIHSLVNMVCVEFHYLNKVSAY